MVVGRAFLQDAQPGGGRDRQGQGRGQWPGREACPGDRPGDRLRIRKEDPPIEVVVRVPGAVRGPATVARTLYEETAESVAARERAAEMWRLAPEPSLEIAAGRPTKRDRRLIGKLRGK